MCMYVMSYIEHVLTPLFITRNIMSIMRQSFYLFPARKVNAIKSWFPLRKDLFYDINPPENFLF